MVAEIKMKNNNGEISVPRKALKIKQECKFLNTGMALLTRADQNKYMMELILPINNFLCQLQSNQFKFISN